MNIPLKIVIVGGSAVGKSCILSKFCDGVLAYGGTIGCNFRTKIVEYDGCSYKLCVWDTAGQEKFDTISNVYYRGAHMIVIVYDIGNFSSYEKVDKYISMVEKHDVPFAIVGNKADIELREVTRKNAKSFKDAVFFIETSCKTDLNIKLLFEKVVQYCHTVKQKVPNEPEVDFFSGLEIVTGDEYKQTRYVTLSGSLRKLSLTNVPYDLSVSVSNAIGNAQKHGILSMCNIILWRKFYFVLRGSYLYWFKHRTSDCFIGQLDLKRQLVSAILTSEYILLKYLKDSETKIESKMYLWSESEEDFQEWMTAFDIKESNALNTEEVSLDFIGKLNFNENEDVELLFSKPHIDACTLQCRPRWFLAYVFDYSVYLDFSSNELKFYRGNKATNEFLLVFTKNNVKLWFKPTDQRVFVREMKSFFGRNSFGGLVTKPLLLEMFNMVYKCVCSQLNITPVRELLHIIEDDLDPNHSQEMNDLCLRGCKLIPQDIFAITHALSFYPYLTSINVRDTHMNHKGLVYLLKGLSTYKSLKHLDFGRNKTVDSAETAMALGEFLLKTELENLNFMDTNIGNETFETFFNALQTQATITDVDIGFHDIDDVNCHSISEFITCNNTLRKLCMWNSHITKHGAKTLLDAMENRPVDFPGLYIDLHGSQYVPEEIIKEFEKFTALPVEMIEMIEVTDGQAKTTISEHQSLALLDDPVKLVPYVIQQKFIGEKDDGQYFAEMLLNDYAKVKEIFKTCGKYDYPVLDAVLWYHHNMPCDNLLADVNAALEKCEFHGLLIDGEELILDEAKDEVIANLSDFDTDRRRIFTMIANHAGLDARYIAHFLLDYGDVLNITIGNEGNITSYVNEVLEKWYMRTKKSLRTWNHLRSVLKLLSKGKLIRNIEMVFAPM